MKEKELNKQSKKRKISELSEEGGDETNNPKVNGVLNGVDKTVQNNDELSTVHEVSDDVEIRLQDSAKIDPSTGEVGNHKEDKNNGVDSVTRPSSIHPLDKHPSTTQPRFRILDALSATGLRALRYAKEIPFVSSIVANDVNPNATKSMEVNIQLNNLSSVISTNTGDAIGHMYSVAFPPTGSHGPSHVNRRYDVIDLDPYGTAVPFLDAALQALNDGGLLCVTCTDSGVFASCGYSEKTFALYGGMPVKGPHMHEGGLRLIVHSIASTAAKYGLSIEPLLCLSIDFYARVFIRVRKSPADVKFFAGKTMLVYGCDAGCGAWSVQKLGRDTKQTSKNGTEWYKHSIAQAPSSDRLCEHCRYKTHVAGPMWAGPLHNATFINKILRDLENADPEVYTTTPRIEGMLTTALDELTVNSEMSIYVQDTNEKIDGEQLDAVPQLSPDVIDQHPFFFSPSALSKVIHCVAPSDAAIKGALRHAGYRATRSHCQAGSIKTDAPWKTIWEIMREWTRQKSPIKEGALKKGQPGWNIIKMDSTPENNSIGPVGTSRPSGDASEKPSSDNFPPGEEVSALGRKIVFDEVLGKDRPGKRLVRYQQNPRENWGPMVRAKGSA